jgi:hypothetical protein
MAAWWMAWVLGLGTLGAVDDPASMVAGLSAPRRAERERAARGLEELGDAARPALLKAVESSDLELRGRAAAVLDAIEGRVLARPTMVTLDYKEKPLGEVVDAISERSGLGVILEVSGDQKKAEKKVTLVGSEPVTFWDAIERLGKVGGVRVESSPNMGWNRGGMMGGPGMGMGRPMAGRAKRTFTGNEVMLVPENGPAAPGTISGRFQLAVTNIHHQRDRTLGVRTGRPPLDTVIDVFEVRLRVTPEPGLNVGRVGEVEGLEAEDDMGQSLVPHAPAEATTPQNSPFDVHGGRTMPTAVRLRYPDRPGSMIRRLKGVVAVTVVGTKPEPVSASLVKDLDRPVQKGDVTLTIHAARGIPDLPPVRTVALSITRPEPFGQGFGGSYGFNRTANLVPASAQGVFEFVDAQGKVVERVPAAPFLVGDGQHRTVRFNQAAGVAPAVEVRYFGPTWTTLPVPFEFRDLPMP